MSDQNGGGMPQQDNPFDLLGKLDDAPTLEALAAQWNIELPGDFETPLATEATVSDAVEAAPEPPAAATFTPALQPVTATQVPTVPQAPTVPQVPAVPQAQPVVTPQPQPVVAAPSAPQVQVPPAPQPAPQPVYTPQPAPAPVVTPLANDPYQLVTPDTLSIPDDDDDGDDDAEATPLKAVLRLRRRIVSAKEGQEATTHPAPAPAQPQQVVIPVQPRPPAEPPAQESLSSKLPVIESAPPRKRVTVEAPRTQPAQSQPKPQPEPKKETTGIIHIEQRHRSKHDDEEEDYGPPRLITGSPTGESFEDAILRRRKERHDKRVRIAVACAVLAAIVLIAGVYQFTKGNVDAVAMAQADIETYDVIRRDFVKTVEASGSLAPVSSTDLAAEVDGII